MVALRASSRVYPRVCGGTGLAVQVVSFGKGLSPRVRGNQAVWRGAVDVYGSIPACAGEPLGRPRACACRGVYPRVCGGTVAAAFSSRHTGGLSPRVRGNRDQADRGRHRHGSIPACAGEPAR